MRNILFYLIAITLFLAGCGSNKEMIKFLKTCNESDAYENGFIHVDTKELKEKLNHNETLRYVGSDNELHYLIHYYDVTIKMQTGFKVKGNINALKHKIDFQSNFLYKKEHGKYLESYTIEINQL